MVITKERDEKTEEVFLFRLSECIKEVMDTLRRVKVCMERRNEIGEETKMEMEKEGSKRKR